MEINLIFVLTVVPAIILYGIAKSGLGGSISLISVPLMTLVMPLSQALAIILPILIFSDIVAVYRFRKEFDFSTLKLIVPFAGMGIFVGSLTFSYFSEDILKFIVGLMGFLFTAHYFLFKKNNFGWLFVFHEIVIICEMFQNNPKAVSYVMLIPVYGWPVS